jgi:hypothetical protein
MPAWITAIAGIVIALIAACVALWQGDLLRRQLRHSEVVNRAILYQEAAKLTLNLDAFFVDHPYLRPYFYSGKAIPSRKRRYAEVEAVAEMVADLAESVLAAEPLVEGATDSWSEYFQHIYTTSPALREYLANYGHWYPPSVHFAITGGQAHEDGRRRQPRPPG